MESSEIRRKFLEFFVARGHAVVPSSSLIPDDPSVLLTTAGMQQFKPYYTGEADPMATIHPTVGKPLGSRNAVSIQKSFRTSDIDEVGDERHLTFFEMMGNFSFGGYFKKEAITYAHEFLTKELGLTISYVTIFQGKQDIGVPKDEESRKIWQSLGVKDIREEGMEDVFWGPTGSSGPCGPTTEIYCKNAAGQDIEIWNIVFNEFFFPGSREELLSGASGKKLERLKAPGVDTGMGLERLAMVAQGKKSIFETDLFASLMKLVDDVPEWSQRIIADHARAATFLATDGVIPSNKEQGYILRRLVRRALAHRKEFGTLKRFERGADTPRHYSFLDVIEEVIRQYQNTHPQLNQSKERVIEVIRMERESASRTYEAGKKKLDEFVHRAKEDRSFRIEGKDIFSLVTTYGFSLEWIKDIGKVQAVELDIAGYEEAFKKHQELSRAGATAKFGGHGLYLKTGEVTIRDESEVERVTRLHTATHLLHAALRAVLGSEVRQDGSDITVERTRFDFKFGRKVLPEELKKVEQWVNDAVARDLKVEWEETTYDEALQKGALGFFREKYPPRVKVYSMIDAATGEALSREFCGGPHVQRTAAIGVFKIIKEEASSAGVRRIRAVVE